MIEKITKIDLYIDYVNTLDTALSNQSQKMLLFRGQPNCKRRLRPAIARTNAGSRSLCDVEKEIFNEFKRLASSHIHELNISTGWDEMALAQHYGLPTRLLDWTSSPLIALWFACRTKREDDLEDRIVWIFEFNEKDKASKDEIIDTDPLEITAPRIFKPNHLTNRIRAQAGWFSIHSNNDGEYIELDKWQYFQGRFKKVIIPNEVAHSFMMSLDLFHINASTLMPELDGISAHLKWKYLLTRH